jgi:uncharacterized protein (DUF1499 family)
MKWLLALLLIPLCLLVGALALNRAPLWQPPGALVRLQLYLTTNLAETRPDHVRPELRPLLLALPLGQVDALLREAIRRLHWQPLETQGESVRAVAVTPLLRFKDDIEVNLQSTTDGTLVNVRSQSRVGKGDLAANTRHILDLYRMLVDLASAQVETGRH